MTLYSGMNNTSGKVITDIDHLRQSVRDILLTPQGSRIARREYGSLLSVLIDQPQNPALRLQVMSAVYVALSRWERLQRGVASFSLQLAEGRADLYTEMPVKVSGFKQPIDDAEWTITTLTHTVSPDNGFTTSLELEVRIDDFEME